MKRTITLIITGAIAFMLLLPNLSFAEVKGGVKFGLNSAKLYGDDVEPIIVRSDGTRPIIHIREDIESTDDPKAVRLSIAANRIHEVDFLLDPDVLEGFGEIEGVDLDNFWSADELKSIGVYDEPEFQEYDESVADDISVCECPNCGNEHVAKEN